MKITACCISTGSGCACSSIACSDTPSATGIVFEDASNGWAAAVRVIISFGKTVDSFAAALPDRRGQAFHHRAAPVLDVQEPLAVDHHADMAGSAGTAQHHDITQPRRVGLLPFNPLANHDPADHRAVHSGGPCGGISRIVGRKVATEHVAIKKPHNSPAITTLIIPPRATKGMQSTLLTKTGKFITGPAP